MSYYDKYKKYKNKYLLKKFEDMIKNNITLTLFNIKQFLYYPHKDKLLYLAEKYKHEDMIILIKNN